MRHKYLAIFVLPAAQPEHKRIIEVISDVSRNDYQPAFFGASKGSNCIGFLFTSDLMPWQIDFSKIIMNDDSFLIVEIGEQFAHQGLGKAAAWLKSHQT